jgi:hypothetical protein
VNTPCFLGLIDIAVLVAFYDTWETSGAIPSAQRRLFQITVPPPSIASSIGYSVELVEAGPGLWWRGRRDVSQDVSTSSFADVSRGSRKAVHTFRARRMFHIFRARRTFRASFAGMSTTTSRRNALYNALHHLSLVPAARLTTDPQTTDPSPLGVIRIPNLYAQTRYRRHEGMRQSVLERTHNRMRGCGIAGTYG